MQHIGGIEALGSLQAIWDQAYAIWIAGGWGMAAIAINALVLFGLGMHIQLRLLEKGLLRALFMKDQQVREWVAQPGQRKGAIGELLDFVIGERKLDDMGTAFAGITTSTGMP